MNVERKAMETRIVSFGRLRTSLAAMAFFLGAGTLGCSDVCSDVDGLCGQPGTGGSTGTDVVTNSTGTSPSTTTTASAGDGGSGASTSSQGGDGASGQGGDGGGGNGPGCELVEGQALGEQCGIFVDGTALEDGDGTPASPRTSIAAAIEQASSGQTIYVCSDHPHVEAVTLSMSVFLVGGLACGSWTYAADGRTVWTAQADAIPLRITAASTDARVEGFAISAADAAAPGGSSIAVLVHEATAEFVRSELFAGDGATGAAGVQAEPVADAMDGEPPEQSGCVGTNGAIGGGGGQNTCQGSVRSGGRGGSGTPDPVGDDANPGNPLPPNGGGTRGLGEGTATCATGGTGGDGAAGDAGSPGAGATTAVGSLGPSGFLGAAGGAGTSIGTPGAGGGGGGGANLCDAEDGGGAGHAGGGGGAGGCGGNVGAGGGGGGASIALASIDATVSLTEVTVSAADGGDGGQGAAGQLGQEGGSGGPAGGADSCPGGRGGDGGQGGSGGGGRGGHAVAIAHVGTAPAIDDTVVTLFGNPGAGGLGGVGVDIANTGGTGADGEAVATLELPGE